jgi:hypothetical protein
VDPIWEEYLVVREVTTVFNPLSRPFYWLEISWIHLLVALQVADRGYYELKPEYWKEFDPLFAHYYLNEMEEAEVSEFCTILGQHILLYTSLCVLTLSTLICAIRLTS